MGKDRGAGLFALPCCLNRNEEDGRCSFAAEDRFFLPKIFSKRLVFFRKAEHCAGAKIVGIDAERRQRRHVVANLMRAFRGGGDLRHEEAIALVQFMDADAPFSTREPGENSGQEKTLNVQNDIIDLHAHEMARSFQ